MSMKDFDQLMKSINGGIIAPVYVIHGVESYFIDRLEEAITEQVVVPGTEAFNQAIFYGRDTHPDELLAQVRRMPMMADRQLVVLREAQSFRSKEALTPILQKPIASTVFVISHKHKRVDKRKAPFNKMDKSVIIAEMKELYDNQVSRWLSSLLKEHKVSLTPTASQLLISHLGRNLSNYINAIAKIKSYQPEGKVDVKVISEVIGINRDYNVFELTDAIGLRDSKKVLHITEVLMQDMRSHPMVLVISSIYTYVAKLYAIRPHLQDGEVVRRVVGNNSPFILKKYVAAARAYRIDQLEDMMDIMRTTDLKSKGISSAAMPQEDLLYDMMLRLVGRF